jgi:exodeoxyribonuclease-1
MLTDPNLPTHYEAMLRIAHKLREWSPTVFIGYNTLAFDEPLLRQAFYQTLQSVYLTNTKGNQRADVLRLTQATAALAPNNMAVPMNSDGKPTLKLDMLAPANGFAHENAHDAMADVEATIFMARLIRDRAAAVWNALIPLTDRTELVARVLSGEPRCLVERYRGQSAMRAVVGCGQSVENRNMLGVFDLTHEPGSVLSLDVDDLVKAMSGQDRSIRVVYANKMPAIVDLSLVHDLEGVFGVRPDEIIGRAEEIVEDNDFRRRVDEALSLRYPPRPAANIVEERIYEGFPSRADEERKAAFHAAPWAKRVELVEGFGDDRLRELGRRLVFLEQPATLNPDRRRQLEIWLSNRRHGREDVDAGRTISEALSEAVKLKEEKPETASRICDIEAWLQT